MRPSTDSPGSPAGALALRSAARCGCRSLLFGGGLRRALWICCCSVSLSSAICQRSTARPGLRNQKQSAPFPSSRARPCDTLKKAILVLAVAVRSTPPALARAPSGIVPVAVVAGPPPSLVRECVVRVQKVAGEFGLHNSRGCDQPYCSAAIDQDHGLVRLASASQRQAGGWIVWREVAALCGRCQRARLAAGVGPCRPQCSATVSQR